MPQNHPHLGRLGETTLRVTYKEVTPTRHTFQLYPHQRDCCCVKRTDYFVKTDYYPSYEAL